MKTAGVALGVTGGFVNFYLAVLTLNIDAIMEYPGLREELGCENIVQFISAWKWALAAVLFVSAVFGIAGALTLSRKGLVSGIMFIAAALFAAASVGGIPAGLCFIIAGIFSFIKRNCPDAVSSEDAGSDLGI